PVVYYLVKWCSLPYEDSTWELQEDVDEAKIAEFKRIQARHPELKRQPRPQAGAWKKLEASHEYKNHNQLREYQLEGVNWLLFNWYNRQNCILADEMGLGKTIQSIAFLQEVHGAGVRGPYLVIAPLSTIANWEREFGTWTHLNTIVYHGSLASRQMIQQYEMYCKDSKPGQPPGDPAVRDVLQGQQGAEEQIVAELRASLPSPPPPDLALQALVRSAGKLVLLDKLLPRLRAGGHKVLVFSQMVRCLDILEDYLIQKRSSSSPGLGSPGSPGVVLSHLSFSRSGFCDNWEVTLAQVTPQVTSPVPTCPQIQQFSKKEIEDLLRKGAYAAIMDEDDEGAKFCEEDIEQILLRRSTTITIESQGQGSTFAKVRRSPAQV
ncbi:hypothetical protein HGM15179_020686, partial [Zosterops borbonicus]